MKIIIIVLFLLFVGNANSQPLDNTALKNSVEKLLHKMTIKEFDLDNNNRDDDGLRVAVKELCTCMSEKLVDQIPHDELEKEISKGEFSKPFMDKYFFLVESCIKTFENY